MTQSKLGPVVVVTGATGGVGRAVVRRLARHGALIGLLARGEERLLATKREVVELGGRALPIPTDVADQDQVDSAASAVEEAFGPIDVWINNAMTSVLARSWDIEPEEYRRVMDVTFLGQVYGTLSALRRMRPRDRGKIILVGSALAYRGIPLQAAYCGAKHAIQGFFESLRTELMNEGSGVKLSIAHLPGLNTTQFRWVRSRLPNESQPVPPIFQPEVAADAIVWLLDHDRRALYVGGSTVKTVIGNRIAPWLADWYLARKGIEDQQIDEPRDRVRADNLFTPPPGDRGAHGPFDARAKGQSLQLWATKHRGALGSVLLGAALFFGINLWSRSGRRARLGLPR